MIFQRYEYTTNCVKLRNKIKYPDIIINGENTPETQFRAMIAGEMANNANCNSLKHHGMIGADVLMKIIFDGVLGGI